MSVTAEQVDAAQAVYTPWTLAVYDWFVLGVSNRFLWRCPTPRLRAHYARHVTDNHLDVGVGTGYFLDKTRFPSCTPRVALLDLNENALAHAARRIERYAPETYRRNVLEPVRIDGPCFDSVGLNYLLHCLPGTIESKTVALDHLAALVNPGGVLFGATLLGDGVRRSWAARRLMALYNRKGICSNERDDLEGLTRALGERFDDVSVEVVGCAALFSGTVRGANP